MASTETSTETAIPVRNLRFDLSEKTPRYWYDESPGRTHIMNALSTTFPAGEAFFVRSVLHFRDQIDDPRLLEEIRGFAGQEGIHAREHRRHVEILVGQGYGGIETLNKRMNWGLHQWNRLSPRGALAMTASIEHLTAIMAEQALREPSYWADPMHPDMAAMWQWHALEETEHKAVAFDVLARVAPGYPRRVLIMLLATFGFLAETFARWLYLGLKDGSALRPEVWIDTFRFLWSPEGLFRRLLPTYRTWFRRDFHPSQLDDGALIHTTRARLAI